MTVFTLNYESIRKVPNHMSLISCLFRLHEELSVLSGYREEQQILYPLYLLMLVLLLFLSLTGRQADAHFLFSGSVCGLIKKSC